MKTCTTLTWHTVHTKHLEPQQLCCSRLWVTGRFAQGYICACTASIHTAIPGPQLIPLQFAFSCAGGHHPLGIEGWRFVFLSVGIISFILGILNWCMAHDPRYAPDKRTLLNQHRQGLSAKVVLQELGMIMRIPSFLIIIGQVSDMCQGRVDAMAGGTSRFCGGQGAAESMHALWPQHSGHLLLEVLQSLQLCSCLDCLAVHAAHNMLSLRSASAGRHSGRACPLTAPPGSSHSVWK